MPEVEIRSVDPEPRVDGRVLDLAVLGEVKGRPVRFLVEAKASGYPRDVQQAIWQLDGLRRLEQPVADVPLLAAPAISETGRELVTEVLPSHSTDQSDRLADHRHDGRHQ